MNIALIIAGGKGQRMQQEIPKQFLNVNDKPVIIYTLEAFQSHPDIDKIGVVCVDGWHDILRAYARQYRIDKLDWVVSGGENGQSSIRNGVFHAEKLYGDGDIILVHDAIRPMVSHEIISDCRYEPIPTKLVPLQSKHTKMLLLLNVAEHDNIGDHLITIAEKEFLESRFSEFPCVEVSDVEYMWFHRWLKNHVSQEDIIFLTGGGFLGSLYLYNGEFNFRSMLVEFPHNAIITFPQTVYFEENLRGEMAWRESCEMYKAHPHLTLIHRESNSYQRAKGMLSNAQMELIPDIVLSLDYSKGNVGMGGKGVNICLRSDKESLFHKQKNLLCTALADRGYHLFYTSMHAGCAISESARMQICKNKREEILSSDLVITDTLHCMILCAITGTPCIAIDTISHKIKYVHEWLKDLEYIKLATTSQKVLSLVSEMFALGKSQFPINDIRPLFIPLENRIKEAAQICPQN